MVYFCRLRAWAVVTEKGYSAAVQTFQSWLNKNPPDCGGIFVYLVSYFSSEYPVVFFAIFVINQARFAIGQNNAGVVIYSA